MISKYKFDLPGCQGIANGKQSYLSCLRERSDTVLRALSFFEDTSCMHAYVTLKKIQVDEAFLSLY